MVLINNTMTDPAAFSEQIFECGLNIYEVIRVFDSKPIFLQDNLLRLENSIKKSNLDLDIATLHIEDQLEQVIRLEKIHEGNLKYVLHITNQSVDEYVYQIPHAYPTEKDYQNGVDTISCPAMRENPEVKYVNSGLRTLTNRLIKEHRVYEVLLTDREGYVTEGSRSNVFFIKGNGLYTASTRYVLPGTSRKRVLDICKKHHIKVVEERVAYTSLADYDAAFITGTSPLLLPIRSVDKILFNPQNQLLIKLMNAYFSLLERS